MDEKNNEQSYDTVARYLDGEAVRLDRPQKELAEEISADEEAVEPSLDVEMPPQTSRRALHRMQAAAGGIARNVLRALGVGAAVAAAAALVLTGLNVLTGPGSDAPARTTLPPELLVETLPEETSFDTKVQTLSDQIEQETAAVLADTATSEEDLDELGRELIQYRTRSVHEQ